MVYKCLTRGEAKDRQSECLTRGEAKGIVIVSPEATPWTDKTSVYLKAEPRTECRTRGGFKGTVKECLAPERVGRHLRRRLLLSDTRGSSSCDASARVNKAVLQTFSKAWLKPRTRQRV